MSGKKKLLIGLLTLLILAAALAGAFWHLQHYRMVDFRFYPKDARILDLRGEKISLSHYRKLQQQMPGCQILWDVPFQDGVFPNDIRELILTDLTEEDIAVLEYFPQLESLHAESCRDYDQLAALMERRPDLQIRYTVELNGTAYAPDTWKLSLTGITEADISLLRFLPELHTVVAGGAYSQDYHKLQTYCQEQGIQFLVDVGGRTIQSTTRSLTITGADADTLGKLRLLPELRILYLSEPQVEAEALLAFAQELSDVQVLWDKTIFGQVFTSNATEIDLTYALSSDGTSGPTPYERAKANPIQGEPDEKFSFVRVSEAHPIPDKSASTQQILQELEDSMGYFPQAESVLLLGCYLDNDALAAFREKHREDYRVVWMVECGELATRTDTVYFMPIKCHVYYFFDSGCVNLKYCEDLTCVDIGHMAVTDISFVEHLPKLKYLILAHTSVRDITPLETCKSLIFLEIDWTGVKDVTPLLGCTALEDLNVGNTFMDLDPLYKMTWLKNLWMVNRKSDYWDLSQKLTNTHVVGKASATVGGGWRRLPNYYAMRDMLKMYYMPWA